MLNRIISTILSIMLSLVGLPVDGVIEKYEPTAEIITAINCDDKNPEIEVSFKKTSLRLKVENDDVILSGAFRDLEIESVNRKSLHTLVINTEGEVNDDYSIGYIIFSENVTKAKTSIQTETEINMSHADPGIVGGIDIETIGKKAIKSRITSGLKKIPYISDIVTMALDPTINDILGLSNPPTMNDLLNELKAISQQLNELSELVTASSQEILKSIYDDKNLQSFNTGVTQLRDSINGVLSELAAIEGSGGSEYYRFLKTADLLEFNEKDISDMVKQTRNLTNYLDGSQISGKKQKGIFEKAYNYICTESVLGGEAAILVAPYVNEVSGVFAYSYKLMALVLNAKLWVHDHYNDILDAAETDKALKNIIRILENGEYADNTNYNYWKNLVSENDDTSVLKIHNKHFSDENPDSTANKYNSLIADNWFSYIRSTEVTSDDIKLNLVPMNGTLGSTAPTELGVNTNTKTAATEGMVNKANSDLRAKMYSAVSKEDIKRIVAHVFENKNNVFYDTSEVTTPFTEASILDMLEEYGFKVPSGSGNKYFTDDSSKSYTHDEYANTAGVAWDQYIANLKVNGTDCGAKMSFNKDGSPVETLDWNDVTYYDYWHDNRDPSSKKSKNTVEDCTFYYFSAAPLEINSESDFTDFIKNITDGDTYYQRTVLLAKDIDLSSIQYGKIWEEAKNSSAFRGTFDGQFHTINGLNDFASNANSGLFRTLGDGAKVCNIIFKNVNINSKANCGTLAGNISGNAIVNAIRVDSGKVSGTSYIGGLIGKISSGSLVIKECDNFADITASDSYAGGVIGGSPNKYSQNISLCTNHGDVTVTKSEASTAAGIVSYLANDSQDPAHTISHCINYGTVSNGSGYAGGIIGHLDSDSLNHNIRKNTNEGKITSTNGYAGGIVSYTEGGGSFDSNINTADITGKVAGGILAESENEALSFKNCSNEGTIKAVSNASGIAARLGDNSKDSQCSFENCSNSGAVASETGNAGGIVAHLDTDNTSHSFTDCTNTADITALSGKAGGIIGYSEGGGNITENHNRGNITGKTAGGIVGENEDDHIQFKACANSGIVKAVSDAGGILGYTGNRDHDKSFEFDDCFNYGYIEAAQGYAGAIAGVVDTDSMNHRFAGCKNLEAVKGHLSTGGIVGKLSGGASFKSCINYKEIISETTCAGGIAGYVVDDACTFKECKNAGEIKGVQSCGGIVGEAGSKSEDDAFTFTGCVNTGIITSSTLNAGGIIGMLKTDNKNHSFSGCRNKGDVNGKTSAGSMIGFMYGGGTIVNCENTAKVTASDAYAGGMVGRIEDDRCTFTDNTNSGTVSAPRYCGNTCGYDGRTKTTY